MENEKTLDELWEKVENSYLEMGENVLSSLSLLYEVLEDLIPEGNKVLVEDKIRRMRRILNKDFDNKK